jgi:hypothetical protein
LNTILDEMQQGESAVKRLQELDNSRGLQDPADVVRRMRGNQNPVQSSSDLLGDAALASQRLQQAQKMEREAKGLLAEAQRLMDEAKSLDPTVAPAPAIEATPTKARKTRAKVSV